MAQQRGQEGGAVGGAPPRRQVSGRGGAQQQGLGRAAGQHQVCNKGRSSSHAVTTCVRPPVMAAMTVSACRAMTLLAALCWDTCANTPTASLRSASDL